MLRRSIKTFHLRSQRLEVARATAPDGREPGRSAHAPRIGEIGAITQPSIVLDTVLNASAHFDPLAYAWIGRLAMFTTFGVVWHTAPVGRPAPPCCWRRPTGLPAPGSRSSRAGQGHHA